MVKIEELVVQAKNGNEESYSELVKLLKPHLQNIAMARLNNTADADDAVQITIFTAYKKLKDLRDNKFFKTWITKILINECNRIYRNYKKDEKLLDKYSSNIKEASNTDLDFDSIIDTLNNKRKKIFELYYKDELTVKEISKRLNMSENTIKSELSRGRQKIKSSFKKASIVVIILCLFVTTSVIAISLINYLRSLFEITSVGAKNDGVLTAIEHLDWYQELDMPYIDLSDGYKIRFEYILMDEMNLYLVVDFESENDISKFNNISLPDIKIINENNEVICDRGNILSNQIQMHIGDKLQENSSHHMKSLIYMYTDSFPICKTLNISFSKVVLYSKSLTNKIQCDASFQIDLSEKFLNRKYTSYVSNECSIKKAIVTETGFYAIIETDYFQDLKVSLIDQNKNIHNCYYNLLSTNSNSNILEYIIMCNFNDIENEKLKLVIYDNVLELKKQ